MKTRSKRRKLFANPNKVRTIDLDSQFFGENNNPYYGDIVDYFGKPLKKRSSKSPKTENSVKKTKSDNSWLTKTTTGGRVGGGDWSNLSFSEKMNRSQERAANKAAAIQRAEANKNERKNRDFKKLQKMAQSLLLKNKGLVKTISTNTSNTTNTTDMLNTNTTAVTRGRPKGSKNKVSLDAAPNAAEGLHLAAKILQKHDKFLMSGKAIDSNTRIGGAPVGSGNDSTTVPTAVDEDKRSIQIANSKNNKTIHKTNFRTGNPSSRALLRLAKQNGTHYETMWDSKVQAKATSDRNQSFWGSGFNSRAWRMPSSAQTFTWKTLAEATRSYNAVISNSEELTYPWGNQKAIFSCLFSKNEFLFHNSSSTLPAVLKIHIVHIKEPENMVKLLTPTVASANALMTRSAGSTAAQLLHAIPSIYLHDTREELGSDGTVNGPTEVWTADTSLQRGGDLTKSYFFKSNATVIETFTKKLAPMDFWQFTHTHHFGGGVDFNEMLNKVSPELVVGDRSLENLPVHYTYLFEVQGTLCEGVYSTAINVLDQFTGKSPTFISTESRVSYCGVLEAPQPLVTSDLGVNPGMSPVRTKSEQRTHIRYFISDQNFSVDGIMTATPTSADKALFVLNKDIVQNRTLLAATAGKMLIPSMVDTSVQNDPLLPGLIE